MKNVPQRTAPTVKASLTAFHSAVIANSTQRYADTVRINGPRDRRQGLHNTI